jgi:cytochrome c551/c552
VVLNDDAETGRFLFAKYGCNSCHAISSTGPYVGPDLAKILHPFSPSELRQFILAPPKDVPMPSYRGRMSDDDLEKIIKFVLVAQTFPRTD